MRDFSRNRKHEWFLKMIMNGLLKYGKASDRKAMNEHASGKWKEVGRFPSHEVAPPALGHRAAVFLPQNKTAPLRTVWSHAGKVWSCGFMSHMRTDKVNGTRAQKWHRGDQREGKTTRVDPRQLGKVHAGEKKEEKRAWRGWRWKPREAIVSHHRRLRNSGFKDAPGARARWIWASWESSATVYNGYKWVSPEQLLARPQWHRPEPPAVGYHNFGVLPHLHYRRWHPGQPLGHLLRVSEQEAQERRWVKVGGEGWGAGGEKYACVCAWRRSRARALG